MIVQISYFRSYAIDRYRSQGPQYPTKPLRRANGQGSGRQHAVRPVLINFFLVHSYSQACVFSDLKSSLLVLLLPRSRTLNTTRQGTIAVVAAISILAKAVLHIPTPYPIAHLRTLY